MNFRGDTIQSITMSQEHFLFVIFLLFLLVVSFALSNFHYLILQSFILWFLGVVAKLGVLSFRS